MAELVLIKTILLGDDQSGFTRYELYGKEYEHPDYVECVIVYVEKNIDGQSYWCRTDESVSLEHLGTRNREFQSYVSTELKRPRDVHAVMAECRKHKRRCK